MARRTSRLKKDLTVQNYEYFILRFYIFPVFELCDTGKRCCLDTMRGKILIETKHRVEEMNILTEIIRIILLSYLI